MPQVKSKLQQQDIKCLTCGSFKKPNDFYISSSAFHVATRRVPYCKTCLKKLSFDNRGNVDINKFHKVLKEVDKPYIHHIFQTACNETPNDVVGNYFRMINSLRQYKGMGWANSMFEIGYDQSENKIANSLSIQLNDFVVTEKIVDKWGYGYTDEEYYYFDKKWQKLIDNYGEKTSLHNEGLITYIRFRVKEELATASGDVKAAKEWASMAKDAATAAKINVSQLSKSDISGGIDLLPQLFEAVESEVGIIPILPYLKEQPYDDADLIIWTIVNYYRRLEDKPRVEYRDIWNFYDNMLEEHYKQKGYSDEMIVKEKVKRNNVFRDLGEVYIEPVYEDSDL